MPGNGEIFPWEQIKQEYITTNETFASLGRKHSVSKTAVFKQAKKGNWGEQRSQWRTSVNKASYAHITKTAIKDQISLYEKTRQAASQIIDSILRAGIDPDGFYRHVVQREEGDRDYKKKWVEDKVLETLNGKNASDAAKAIKDLTLIARTLDDIVDAATKQKLDMDREKLELEKRKAGLSDDIEQECGIAYMPGQDQSLLEGALPDPNDEKEVM
jgi:hypothetical protein